MQQLTVDEAGNQWLVDGFDAAGNPINPRPAPSAQQGRVFSLPPNPKEVRQEARAERTDDRANAAAERAADAAARAADNDRISNEIKRIEIELKRRELTGGDPKTAKEQSERVGRLNALVNQIKRTRQLYNAGPGTTKGLAGALDYAPTDANAQFDVAGASLSQQGLAAFRTPGTGTVSDRDAIMFDRANLPTAATRDVAIEEQLEGLQNRVAEEYRTLGMAVPDWAVQDIEAGKGDQRADNELPQPTNNADLKPPAPGLVDPNSNRPGGGPRETTSIASDQRIVRDQRVAAMLDSMINARAPMATINAALKQRGFPNVSAGDYAAAIAWKNKPENKGKRYVGSDPTRLEDLSALEKAAATPAAAFVSHAGNAASAGLIGAMAGSKGQGALDAMSAVNPGSSLAGGIAGGAGAMIGAEAALAARLGANAMRYASPAADTAYGALMGFNSAQEGQGLQGALAGAGAGLAGNLVGQGIARGAGAAFRGVRDPNVQYLRERGVPTTVGQTVGNSGRVGAAIQNVENALTSLPGLSGVIRARQQEGLEGFNRAAYQELPGHSGATGSHGIAEADALEDAAYGFLDNTRLPLDPPYTTAEQAARAAAPGRFAQDIIEQLDETAGYAQNGALGGRDWQSAVRANRTNRSSIAGEPYANRAVNVHNDIEQNLMGLAQRQGPAGTVDNLNAANALHAQVETLSRALDNGPTQQADELFTPARLDAASRAGANLFQGRRASIMGNRPFYDLTNAGRSVMGNVVPDSGTATRSLVANGVLGTLGATAGGSALGAAAGDAQTGGGLGLGAALLLAAGGSRAGQRAMVSALADRPDEMIRLGDVLRQQARLAGTAGAATGVGLTAY